MRQRKPTDSVRSCQMRPAYKVSLSTVLLLVSLMAPQAQMAAQTEAEQVQTDIHSPDSQSNTSNVGENIRDESLIVLLSFGQSSKPSLRYSLNFRDYPGLSAAFLYLARHEAELYQNVSYSSTYQASYGHAFSSLPEGSGIYSLPNAPSLEHPAPGLAFWRNGSILRSDILFLATAEVGMRDQGNLVFFAELQQDTENLAPLHPRQGLQLFGVEAKTPEAQDFLARLSRDRDAYLASLDQLWQADLKRDWPDVNTIMQSNQSNLAEWKRDAFGYYIRMIEERKGSLPKVGEDLNIILERKAFAGLSAQSLPVIVNFGRDTLPMPFAYYVGKTPKGTRVEIMCPPSATRSKLSTLAAEYGGTRYQWLLDSYKGTDWVYLSFSLEIQ